MKTKLIILIGLIACVVSAQLETNTAIMKTTGVTRRTCKGITYWSDGVADFKATNGGVKPFFSDTNIITFIITTNFSDRLEWDCQTTNFVVTNGCGTNTFSITNNLFYGAAFSMLLYSNTNHPFLVTNKLITDGFTNQ